MPPLSGYLSDLPVNVMLGSWVVAIDSATAFGASQGECTVTIPREYENLDFDGKLNLPIVGLDRRIGGAPTIEGTFIEVTAAKGLQFEPGGTSATASSITTITPGTYGDFLAADQYLENVRAFTRLGGAAAGILCVEFNYALLTVDSFTGSGKGNGSYKMKFEARQASNAASLGVAPYSIKFAASIAAIQTADP